MNAKAAAAKYSTHNQRTSLGIGDWVARTILLACLLNINGVFSMAFGIGQAVSGIMLFGSVLLVALYGRWSLSTPLILLFTAIISYLLLGLVHYQFGWSAEAYPSYYFRGYGGGLVILWGLSGYVARLATTDGLENFLRLARNLLLFSSASILVSPQLYEYYLYLPLSSELRMGGFFGNPNEAAIVSVLAFVTTTWVPCRKHIFQVAALGLCTVATVLTLSKTGMSILVVIAFFSLLKRVRGFSLLLLVAATIVALLAIPNLDILFRAVAESSWLDLDVRQQARILAVREVLGGRLDANTTTGRTILWEIAGGRVLEQFPWGAGLGAGHHLVGGFIQNNQWQGVHNTYLMFWLESGFLPFMLLIAATLAMFSSGARHPLSAFLLSITFVLLADLMGTHTALSARYHNAMLAIVLGLMARAGRWSWGETRAFVGRTRHKAVSWGGA